MTALDFTGLTSALWGAALLLSGATLAVAAGLRLATTRRRAPFARSALAAAFVLALSGAGVLFASELVAPALRHALDRGARLVAAAAVLVAALAALRAGRRTEAPGEGTTAPRTPSADGEHPPASSSPAPPRAS
jgi:hypothetical protein